MAYFKFAFVLLFVVALVGLSSAEADSSLPTEVETPQENNQLDKVQEQLMTAFDSFKKSMEEFASKFNTEDIVQGVQSLTSKIEGYAKQAADQFASSAAGVVNTEQKKEEATP